MRDIAEPTADDFESLLAILPHIYTAGYRERLERLAHYARREAEARRRPRYFMLPEPFGNWIIGAPGANGIAGAARVFHDSKGLRGLALAHQVIERGEPVPYEVLRDTVRGALRPDACCNALRVAARWVRDVAGCAPVAAAIGCIEAGKTALTYRPDATIAEIITHVNGT